MSWQDDPVIEEPKTDWKSDPVIEEPSKLESFGRGVGNNVPFAPQVIAAGESATGMGDEGGYSKNLADWNAKALAAKTANPKTYGAGAVTGTIAPLLIPGVGEALEAAPVVGNAALGAANALSNEDLTKDLSGNLKKAAIGAGVGGTLGKAGEVVGNAVSALKPAGARLEANATSNALNLGTFGVKRLAKGLENPEQVMLRVNKEVNELLPGFIELSDTAGSKFQKLTVLHDSAGKTIGSVVDSASEKMGGKLPEADEAIKELEEAASKYNKLTSARNADAKAELTDTVTRMKELQQNGQLNFKALQDIKSDIGDAYHNPNLDNPGIDKSYHVLTDKMDKILDRVEMPEMKKQFILAKKAYKLTSDLLPAMKRGVAREVASTGGGLTNAALGAGAIFGHPLTAGAGYAAKTAAKLAAPDFAANAVYKGINALKNVPNPIPPYTGQAANQILNNYLVNHFKGR